VNDLPIAAPLASVTRDLPVHPHACGLMPFSAADTHRIFLRNDHHVHVTSESTRWRTLFVAYQREGAFSASLGSVRDHFLVLHLNGKTPTRWVMDGKEEQAVAMDGCVSLIPAGREFKVHTKSENDSVHLYLRHQLVEQVVAEFGPAPSRRASLTPFLCTRDPLLEQLVRGCQAALSRRESSASLYVDHLAWAIAAHLVHRNGEAAAPAAGSPSSPLGKTRLDRIRDYIDGNLSRDIGIDELARAVSLSPVYFARMFKRATGLAPYQFLVQRRVEHAKRLLRSGNLPISEIAQVCGFCHQEHLTRVLRKICGVTPGNYRKATISSIPANDDSLS